jgi:hypothetical protein
MIRKILLALSVLATTLPHAPSAQANSYVSQWFHGNWNCQLGDSTGQMNWGYQEIDEYSVKSVGKLKQGGGSWTPLSVVSKSSNTLEMRFDRSKVIWNLTHVPSRRVATGTTIVQGQRHSILCTRANLNEPTKPAEPKPYGVNTCKQGFVWREAQANDRVCVTPAVRTQTRNENNLAAQRREPNGGAYGPNTCKQGYVWREATTNDPVCVTPQVRAQAADDNKRAGERRVP